MAQIQTRRRADGTATYRVGYRHDHGDGRKLHWTPTFDSAEAAVEVKDMVERLGPELALATLELRDRDASEGAPLLSEWFEEHLRSLVGHATSGTIKGYRDDARHWMEQLGPIPLDALTKDHVLEWVGVARTTETHRSARARAKARAEERPEPPRKFLAAKTIKNAHAILSTSLASAVEAGHIPRNVARGVDLPTDTEHAHRERDIFTEDEWTRFYEAFQEHYQPFVMFMIATGCRIGEASAVQVRDIDLAGPEVDGVRLVSVHVRRAWKKGATGRYLGAPKSRRGDRTLLLAAPFRDLLAPLMQGRDAHDLVFTAPRGGRIVAGRFNERQWAKAKKRAGITKELTPHSLRHTSASWMLMNGVATQIVQHRLGHESLETTSKVYAHLLMDAQVPAAQLTSRALGLGPGEGVKSLES